MTWRWVWTSASCRIRNFEMRIRVGNSNLEIRKIKTLPAGRVLASVAGKRSHAALRPLANDTGAKPPSAATRIRLGRLCSGAFGKAGYSLRFGVEHVEDRHQLGDLQDFLEFAAQMAKPQPRTLRFGAVMSSYERAQPGAVNERHVVHVEDNFLFSRSDEAFYLFAQRVAFFTQHDAAVQRHHGDAIHFSIGHLQSHVSFLLVGKRFRRQPSPEP